MKRLAMALFVCTIAETLQAIRPGAEWTLYGDTYAGLTWIDKTPKPTLDEVNQGILSCQNAPVPLTADQRIANLEAAVTQISDVTNVPVSLPTTQANIAPLVKTLGL